MVDWLYSPDRLRFPLKRENGAWKRITWEEALDTIASKLNALKESDGARSVAIMTGSIGIEDREVRMLQRWFADGFGTPNFLEVGVCFVDNTLGRLITIGSIPVEDPPDSKCILLWAHNPDHSMPVKGLRVRDALRKGAQLVIIDPRHTSLADKGLHVRPRPGTDLALSLAMINVIVDQDLYDRQFVEQWTVGFQELKKHVEQYTPEWAEEVTWVAADDIRKMARMFATSESSCIIQSMCALGHTATGFQLSRAFSILQAITGNIYKPGTWGMMPRFKWPRSPIEIKDRPVGTEAYPTYTVWGLGARSGQAMSLTDSVLDGKPYPIKAAIITAGNFMTSQPDVGRIKATLEKLDFLVVMDLFMTKTAELADIVLPAATFIEKAGTGSSYGAVVVGIPYIETRPKVVEPLEECRSEFRFFSDLARRTGCGEMFPWGTEEDFVDYELAPEGLSMKKLSELPGGGFHYGSVQFGDGPLRQSITPSKKIELYSETLKDMGFDPMPTYREPTQSPVSTPELAKEYPLIMITGARNRYWPQSQMRTIEKLRIKNPEPLAEIHPATAKEYGVADGEMAVIETKKGSIKMKISTTEDIMPRCISLPQGWSDANVNVLTDIQLRDPESGLPQFKAILCRIRKA